MNKQLLDPIGTMCKLCALNFNVVKTKLSIQNHILTLQKPSGYQFLVRIYNGDGRENTSELYYAIRRLIEWYIILSQTDVEHEIQSKKAEIIGKSESLKKMVGYLCESFKKLQRTYYNGNVILALQYYINILHDGYTGNYNKERLPEFLLKNEEEYENLLDYEKLKNMWDIKKLDRICELYDNCYKTVNDKESTQEIKNAFINGYLRSIDAILQTTDIEFQELITNSNKG